MDKQVFLAGTEFEFKASLDEFIAAIYSKRNADKLRSAKYKVKYGLTPDGVYRVCQDSFTSSANYVWRMVGYFISTDRKMQCMPVCADMDLPYFQSNGERLDGEIRGAHLKALDAIVDQIIDRIPADQRHGINAWKRALGF